MDGLENGQEYYFRVRAINDQGNGRETHVYIKPARPEKPDAPTGFAVSPGDSQVTMRWEDPGNPTITKYQYTELGASTHDIPDSGFGESNHTSFTLGGLTNGIEYTFSIIPFNSTGNGVGSGSVNVTPAAPNASPRLVAPIPDQTLTVDGSTLQPLIYPAISATQTAIYSLTTHLRAIRRSLRPAHPAHN